MDNRDCIDPALPYRIADGVWWVGVHQEHDAFQAHAYLIVDGDQSVLVDPGGRRTFPETLRKIEMVTDFANIRYFVCQHQDPDITASLPDIDLLVTRPDAEIVTHWRAQMLMKEYGLRLPFRCVEASEWALDLATRRLRFVFTPYAHFPGAFCTFDEASGVLFSSDLFGGFTDGFNLFAEDESYFEAMRPFHEHYIASNEVLVHAVSKVREIPYRLIAPQHGCIIPATLAAPLLDRLCTLECGLFLLTQGSIDIHRLTVLSKTLRDFTKALILYRDFRDIVDAAVPLLRRLLPVAAVAFYAIDPDKRGVALTPETRYRAVVVTLPATVEALIGQSGGTAVAVDIDGVPVIAMPLAADGEAASAVAALRLDGPADPNCPEVAAMMERLARPLQVAVERELLLRDLDQQRERIYQRSIRDPLTGLFNRAYMQDMVQRLIAVHEREPSTPLAVLLVDIDHFKSVNDQFGHNQGDTVLKAMGAVLLATMRAGDIAVRLGGEEFAVFVSGTAASSIAMLGERLRMKVEAIELDASFKGRRITASFGTALRRSGEDLEALMGRADAALYAAKDGGRNRVCEG